MDQVFENEIKWFTQYQGQVQGPFNTTYLQNTLERLDAQHLEATLIWRRGFAEWLKGSKFNPEEHTMTMTRIDPPSPPPKPSQQTQTVEITPQPKLNQPRQVNQQTQTVELTPPPPAFPLASDDKTLIGGDFKLDKPQNLNQGAFYRVQVSFVDQPMMTKNDLLNLLAKQEDISVVAIQDPKSKEWKEVYAFPDIVEKLGLSRRKHPRVPILAQFTGKSNRHDSFFARIITISEGGVGLTEVYDLKIGDEVEGQMTSPHFFQPINIRADVVYSGLDGYIGLNFSQINDESKSTIIDYMKKFGKSNAGNP